MTAASARALGLAIPPDLVALAFCGTGAVYTVDRLRDLDRDRATAPRRSAFVARHRRGLTALAAAAGLTAAALALRAGPAVAVLAAVVGGLGLLHRRLKHRAWAKPLYLTASWTAVTAGLPVVAARPGAVGVPAAFAVTGVVALTVLANVVLSSLRDAEGAPARLGRRPALALAAGVLAPAAALAWTAGPGPRSLLPLPAAMAVAVAGFRPGERYGLWVVDGALLLGALAALALAAG